MSYNRSLELKRQADYQRGVERIAADYRRMLAADSKPARPHLTAFQQTLKGALFCYSGPRLAHDAEMPDLDPVVEGVDRRTPRKLIADRLRKAVRGRVARDADFDDVELLLRALEQDLDPADAPRVRELLDEVEPDDADDPWSEARDEPQPFPGRPNPGGRMDDMSSRNDTRYPHPGEPADARDRLPHRRARAGDTTKPRRFGATDSAPRGSFAHRFRFATRHTSADRTGAMFPKQS